MKTVTKNYEIGNQEVYSFSNQVDYCVGTGRMGLALQAEYQEQLALVQKEIGFRYIRGHGLFTDDCAIYQEYEDETGKKQAEYNFTYLDLIMDRYLSLGIRPFLELGFMPKKLASGDQTVFYWKGNVTPPSDYEGWAALVKATLSHLISRYGRHEVLTWPIEVWNEPNLPGFWKDADMEEYFHLFEVTIKAVKEVDSTFRVGGPAVCGVQDELWIKAFLDYCSSRKLPLDFVTRHHYTTEIPERMGHYGYAALSAPEDGFRNLQTSRDIIDSFEEYRGMEIHITEFNTSYIPNCPLHDTNQNAAYIAHQLSRLGEVNESYSYWTFGDIFEENGVPFTPFHGGFGLVANGGIPKPTFWTFAFFKRLAGTCIHKSEELIVVKTEDGGFRGVAWNSSRVRNGESLSLEFNLTAKEEYRESDFFYELHLVDEETCNPLKVWHDMGEPSSLSKEENALLKECARPKITSEKKKPIEGTLKIKLLLAEHGVCYFALRPVKMRADRGYDYERVMQFG